MSEPENCIVVSCSESELGKPEVDFSVVATLAAIVMCNGQA